MLESELLQLLHITTPCLKDPSDFLFYIYTVLIVQNSIFYIILQEFGSVYLKHFKRLEN